MTFLAGFVIGALVTLVGVGIVIILKGGAAMDTYDPEYWGR